MIERRSKKVFLEWKVLKLGDKKAGEGVIPIDSMKYRDIKAQLSTSRKRDFDGRRGIESPHYQNTNLFPDDSSKTIRIESENLDSIKSWAGELGLKTYVGG